VRFVRLYASNFLALRCVYKAGNRASSKPSENTEVHIWYRRNFFSLEKFINCTALLVTTVIKTDVQHGTFCARRLTYSETPLWCYRIPTLQVSCWLNLAKIQIL